MFLARRALEEAASRVVVVVVVALQPHQEKKKKEKMKLLLLSRSNARDAPVSVPFFVRDACDAETLLLRGWWEAVSWPVRRGSVSFYTNQFYILYRFA